ncbi:hypothetical protein E0Z10_g7708 [Xylaria hypoxylon]|uniref:DUF1275 domain protein n=1 Tax=Xylaria hypoxylon TaxID=37992 RepID=A0A4Z0YNP8_9PEZI|nr:hypothetical protein E0Z10_g7708 [Xylaria hypoxylon]
MPSHPSSNGYSAVNGSGGSTTTSGDEEQPLLGGSRSLKSGWRKNMMADVNREWTDLILLACYFVTGLLDSASISTWGSFVSMQTGNTVYFGLGIAAPHESTRWIKSGASLGFFCIGSVFFSHFHRHFSPKRRWVLCASFTLQIALIIVAAFIFTYGPRSSDPREAIGWPELVPIALIAFQSCGQAVASRALKHPALTSVVLTSIYCDLFSDYNLLAAQNIERNRRVAAPLLLVGGAIAGGFLAHSSVGCVGALWIAAALKFVMVVAWLVWPTETE